MKVASTGQLPKKTPSSSLNWRNLVIVLMIIVFPWGIYVSMQSSSHEAADMNLHGEDAAMSLGQLSQQQKSEAILNKLISPNDAQSSTILRHNTDKVIKMNSEIAVNVSSSISSGSSLSNKFTHILPVQGPMPSDGIKPLFDVSHKGLGDAIFALACNYPKLYYQRFVGSLRKVGYNDDIVLAVSPVEKMKPGVKSYLQETQVVAYGFDVDCIGKDNCKLKDEFLG